jgi:hypothetical protein
LTRWLKIFNPSPFREAVVLHLFSFASLVVALDRVSYMGYALVDHAWAHLARVRIFAEIPEEDVLNFWASDKKERQDVINWFSSTAARALITQNVPDSAMSMGWTKVADTNYYILELSADQSPK